MPSDASLARSGELKEQSSDLTRIDAFCPLALAGVILLNIVLIWSFPYLPTQDGPAHLYIATVLREYHAPEAAALREVFELNVAPVPNLLIFFLLFGLLEFLPALAAEKALVTLYVVGLPLAAWFAARPLGQNAWITTFLLSLLTLGFTFSMGFYNYSFGTIFFLLGIGCYLRLELTRRASFAVLLFVIGIATFFTHIFPAAALILAIAVTAGWRTLMGWRSESLGSGSNDRAFRISALLVSLRRHALPSFLALLPCAVLVLSFVLFGASDGTGKAHLESGTWLRRGIMLLTVSPLLSFDDWERRAGSVFVIIIAGILFHVFKQNTGRATSVQALQRSSLGALTFSFLLIYAVIPFSLAGAHFVFERFLTFFFAAFFLWLGSVQYSPTFRSHFLMLLMVLALAMPLSRFHQHASISAQREAYVSALEAALPQTGVLLDLIIGPTLGADGEHQPLFRVDHMRHAAIYAAVTRLGPSLKVYQAQSNFFPIRYRSDVNPYQHLVRDRRPDLESKPPRIDLTRYLENTGIRPDVIALWGDSRESRKQERIDDLSRTLKQHYISITQTDRPGPAALYVSRDRRH